MNPKLTCYHCHQKTVDETATGYACAACGQSWASLQHFIQARLAELSQSIESASAQPTSPEPTRIPPVNAGANNPKSWFDRLSDPLTKLLIKLLTRLLKFLPKLIFRLVLSWLTIVGPQN